jgi:DNA uptake protein ComE-like DNA-binding protein
MKSFFKEYFSFSKQDRNSILVLVGIIFIVIAIKFFVLPYYRIASTPLELKKQDSIIKLFSAQIETNKVESINENHEESMRQSSEMIVPNTNSVVILIHQKFNPNEFNFDDWKNAGFPDKFAKTISNYLAKGGKIRKPEDLKKVYGMKYEWYKQIEPYIAIPEVKFEKNSVSKELYAKKDLPIIEMNTADSAALESLPLIGGKTAIKIIKYRNLLGGFVSINQLKEVWGFKDSMLIVNEKRINIDASKISKLNINSASFDQLKKHPYLKFNKAKLLIAYRDQHGKYHNVNELKSSKALTDEDINKILPYLNFD